MRGDAVNLVESALRRSLATLQVDDKVTVTDCGQSVCNGYSGDAAFEFLYGCRNGRLSLGIKSAGCLIQDK